MDTTIRRSKPGPGGKHDTITATAASVWESRMKSEDIKVGIKVFKADEDETVPVSGVKRNNGVRKTWRSEPAKSLVQAKKAIEGKPKSPVQGIRRLRSETAKSSSGSKSPELRKVKSDSGGNGIDAVRLRKEKLEAENSREIGGAVAENGSNGGNEVTSSVEEEDEEEKDELISSNLDQEIKTDQKNDKSHDGNEVTSSVEEEDEEEKDELISSNLDREIKTDQKIDKSHDAKALDDEDEDEGEDDEECSEYENEEKMDVEFGVEIEKKETTIPEQEPVISKLISPHLSKQVQYIEKPKPIIVNKHSSSSTPIKPAVSSRIQRTTSSSFPINKPAPPIAKQSSTVHQRIPKRDSYAYERFPETQNKLQNLADLVMWRDVSKSAFVFGIGAFTIISSSYTKDANISFVSVMSYLGLVYLAAIFLYRSFICRGYEDNNQCKGNVLGEEDAIWLLRLVLPYLNEFLLKIKALFSGDPATTMKLAVLLFVVAKCGSSITIWNMAKLGFFGAFTVPKVFSAYAIQFTAYGHFWIRRFKDAWDCCSHKKAAAFAIFTVVWNFSSVVARIWTVFVLFVAFRCYQQQSLVKEDCDRDSTRGG